jgi:membrane-bound serine protease (ClpP class)
VSVAERRGRDLEFAEAAVREGASITASEAVDRDVVDLVADDLDDLLASVDGLAVEVAGNQVDIDTEGAVVERFELGTLRSILGRIADPNLSYIFLSLGTLAIIYEAANPGLGLSGIIGAVLLVLAFFALSVLPVNAAGIALLVLAIGLFVAELFVAGLGVLAAGGAIALVLSGIFLFDGTLSVSPVVLVPSAAVLGLGSVVAGRAIVRTHRRPHASGAETMVGRVLDVAPIDESRGRTFVDGAWWEIHTDGRPLAGRMRVVEVRGIYLIAEPEEESS